MQSRDPLDMLTSDILIDAVENSDIATIQKFVKFIAENPTGLNPSLENLRDSHGENILHQAIRKGNAEILNIILMMPGCHKLYDSVNDVLADGKTRLMAAVENKNIPQVNLLLTVPGLDVNTGCHKEGGILLWALKFASNSEDMLAVLTNHPGVNVTLEDENGITALTYIFERYTISIIKRLIPLISDLPDFSFGLANKAGKTTLMFLMNIKEKTRDCILSNNSKLKFLISQGIDVNAVDSNGNAAIHYLIKTLHDLRNCDTLLKCVDEFRNIIFGHKEININIINFQCETPLIAAVSTQCRSVVAALIKSGANVNCSDVHGRSLLEILADMAKLVWINYTESHKNKIIYDADCRCIESIACLLMSANIKSDVHAIISLSQSLSSTAFLEKVIFGFSNLFSDPYNILTLFEYLIAHNHTTLIQRLIEKFDSEDEKFNINVVSDGNTVLSYVVYTNRVDLLSVLLSIRSIDLNHLGIDLLGDPLKCRPLLHVAIERNNPLILDAFLNDPRTNINLCARGAGTPLIHALNKKNNDVASRLLDMPHLDVNRIVDEVRIAGKIQCTSALSLAIEKKKSLLVDKIITHPSFNVNNGIDHPNHLTPLMLAIPSSMTLALKLLAMPGVNVNATGCLSHTNLVPPLLFAVRNGGVQIVDAILANTNLDLSYTTPRYKSNILMNAMSFDTCTTRIVNMLIAKFVAVGLLNETNLKGETALHFAVRANQIDWVRLLLDAGISIDTCKKGNRTALQVAQRRGYKEISVLILSRRYQLAEIKALAGCASASTLSSALAVSSLRTASAESTLQATSASHTLLTTPVYDSVWSESAMCDVAPNSPHWEMFDVDTAKSKAARVEGEFTGDCEAEMGDELSLFHSIPVADDVWFIRQPVSLASIQSVIAAGLFSSRPAMPPYIPAVAAASSPLGDLSDALAENINALACARGK